MLMIQLMCIRNRINNLILPASYQSILIKKQNKTYGLDKEQKYHCLVCLVKILNYLVLRDNSKVYYLIHFEEKDLDLVHFWPTSNPQLMDLAVP